MIQNNKVVMYVFWICALILFNSIVNQWMPGSATAAKVALLLIYLANGGFMLYYMIRKPKSANEETLYLIARLGVIIITAQLPVLMVW